MNSIWSYGAEVKFKNKSDSESLRDQITLLKCDINDRDARIQALEDELKKVIGSMSWRLTLPFRELMRWIKSPKQQYYRYLMQLILLLKSNHHIITLPQEVKIRAYGLLLKLAVPQSELLVTINNSPKEIYELPNLISQLLEGFSSKEKISLLLSMINLKRLKALDTRSPQVSVVIPFYGQIEYTLTLLASISQIGPTIPFELLLIDDCSLDDSYEVLSRIEGIRLLRNDVNQGFIRSCNLASREAKGEYLLFLNNDTEVTKGWMEELVKTFDAFPETGLVGSKLVYPNGKLQEAGGIIWQDGSAWNFGRMQDPSNPIFNYAREVDYCSGASIMVPKALFLELGGFDELYLPAYCEDADLALKIRAMGLRVIYQPLSVAIHYEGITSGTDLSSGIKAYQVINLKKMYERWAKHLLGHQLPGEDVNNAKDRCANRRVLVVDHTNLTPDKDAGSLVIFNMLLLFREMGYQVTFIGEDNLLYEKDKVESLQRVGIEVLYRPYINSLKDHIVEHGQRYELVVLVRPLVVERHVKDVRNFCPTAKILFHTVDLHFLRMQRESEIKSDPKIKEAAERMKSIEYRAIYACDATIVVSEMEKEYLLPEFPGKQIEVLPLILDAKEDEDACGVRRDIIFVGSFNHPPNVDAILYFCQEVMPIIRKAQKNIALYIVGSNPPPEVKGLVGGDVFLLGYVHNLERLYSRFRVSIAPLRFGAGVKGKIGSALCAGVPVVATTLAGEGMSLDEQSGVILVDDPEEMAHEIIQIHQDDSRWTLLSQDGKRFVNKQWGAKVSRDKLTQILFNLGLEIYQTDRPLTLYSPDLDSDSDFDEYQFLDPISISRSQQDFKKIVNSANLVNCKSLEDSILKEWNGEEIFLKGRCIPCNANKEFILDMKYGGKVINGINLPNWRERLECPSCKMNNRQRLITSLIMKNVVDTDGTSIYFMEKVTPIFSWAKNFFKNSKVIGSEYLDPALKGGTVVNGIEHEDVENLSFSDECLNLIVSNDVFEHVPNYLKALSECYRVLKPGGVMLATIPFDPEKSSTEARATVRDGVIEHILQAQYHGNPLSEEGSLVFSDFGWDILVSAKNAGFSDAFIEGYVAPEFGHYAGPQLVFKFSKA